jgi:acyl-CoA thioester hydrolase
MSEHVIDIRVYYEDTDAGGIVYHSNYLNFAERARCEMMRDLGHECSALQKDTGIMFVLKAAELDYIAPSKLDDALQVATTVAYMKNTSFQLHQNVRKDGKDICRMIVTLVCVNTDTIKPVRLPDELRTKLEPYLKSEA